MQWGYQKLRQKIATMSYPQVQISMNDPHPLTNSIDVTLQICIWHKVDKGKQNEINFTTLFFPLYGCICETTQPYQRKTYILDK